jgi:hypothetical protein
MDPLIEGGGTLSFYIYVGKKLLEEKGLGKFSS